ncbi:MAG TPA: SDR family oxidoreductase [Polyangiales bacterium]
MTIFDLKGHVAVITGGNGGIGLGLARGLAKAGASLAIWGRNPHKNAAAVDMLRALGAEADSFACELSDEAQVVAAMAATLERFGRVDSCFANAGVAHNQAFLEMTQPQWNAVMQVNLVGVMLTFREATRHMVTRGGGGKLVAVSSVASLHGVPKGTHYSASKAALTGLVKSLAVEFARHDIQANAILPGWIATDMTAAAQSWEALDQAILHRTPAHRWGTPEDFEGVAVYLASKESRFHNGDVLVLDGGYTSF